MERSQTNPGQSLTQMEHNGYGIFVFSSAFLLLVSLVAFWPSDHWVASLALLLGVVGSLGAVGG